MLATTDDLNNFSKKVVLLSVRKDREVRKTIAHKGRVKVAARKEVM